MNKQAEKDKELETRMLELRRAALAA